MDISPVSTQTGINQNNNNTQQADKTSATLFKEFMEKTPQEMIFESFLKRHDLTKEEFEKLPLEKRAELLKEFEEYMKQEMGIV